MSVRTRFAPSPTGFLHIGGARTALFCWLHARHQGGEFVLRIEDTDRERSTEVSIQAIIEGLRWLGLEHDIGPVFQSDRFDRYQEIAEQLLTSGYAYRCYCSKERLEGLRLAQLSAKEKPRYDGYCRERCDAPGGVEPVIRFKRPLQGAVIFDDLVRGRIAIDNEELDDLIIVRSDGTPTYNFCVVVDDIDMEITHVIRGDDHVNNTPRQINIFKAIGGALPKFAHVPMILGADGQRLSKRHGAVSVMQFKEDGYLPEALVNYLVRLGWSYGDQEIFPREEMIRLFDITDVNRAAASFDFEKLQWLNQHYIKESDPEYAGCQLAQHLETLGVSTSTGPAPEQVFEAQRERAKTWVEMAEKSAYFYRDFEDYAGDSAKRHLRPVILEPLCALRERLGGLTPWTRSAIHTEIVATAQAAEITLGKLGQPLRVAVCGTAVSPPFDITLELIGKNRTLARIDRALAYIKARSNLS